MRSTKESWSRCPAAEKTMLSEVKRLNDGLVEAGDGLDGSEDGSSERVIAPEVLGEGLVDDGVGGIFIHLDLLEDDSLFALEIFLRELRVEDEIGEDVEGWREVFVEDLDVEADGFFAGEGV
jgi:hypothetical protein